MKLIHKNLFATTAVIGLLLSMPALADSVEIIETQQTASQIEGTALIKTIETQKDLPDTKKIDFMSLDTNGDKILSQEEVGKTLFDLFDADGNRVIDNIEFKKKTIMTVIPMQRETITMTDTTGDGKANVTTTTSEDFILRSGLAKFDKNMDGLSPEVFIEKRFNAIDSNHDGLIQIKEWQRAYSALIKPIWYDQDHYNN